jgi:hypothetical protein
MAFIRLAVVILMVGMFAGCRPDRPAEEVATRDAQQLVQSLRQELGEGALVGIVALVREQDRLVAVTEVDPRQFQVGDRITFLDQDHQSIGPGRVVRVTDRAIHVQYEDQNAMQRAPRQGDAAVRIAR